jgi:hypothetical protein
VAGQRYAIESSGNFSDWSPVQTHLLISNSAPVLIPATNTHRYFRAQWLP